MKSVSESKPALPSKAKQSSRYKVGGFKINITLKDIILWLLLSLFVVSLFTAFRDPSARYEEKPLSVVMGDIKKGAIEEIVVEDTRLTITYKTGETNISRKEPDL